MLPNQENLRIKEDICGLILTIMAHGCNIGIYVPLWDRVNTLAFRQTL